MNLFRLKNSNSTNPKSNGRGLLLVGLVLASFALSPVAKAVSPAPDGGYPNYNTAEGEDALFSLTSGIQNTALGFHALYSDTTGDNNTAVGRDALLNNTTGTYNTATGVDALLSNTTGNANVAIGINALSSNTSGHENTATGGAALSSNITGIDNTATGAEALGSNTAGDGNTATGRFALRVNQTGNYNTATGFQALYSNTADGNTATGSQALYSNATGIDNTASGFQALYSNTADANTATGTEALLSNTTGFRNTAYGERALKFNTISNRNTAIGGESLFSNTTGIRNAATGYFALGSNTTGDRNTANGSNVMNTNTTGSFNIALGYAAGSNLTTGDNNIDIGNVGVAGEANTIRIGSPVAGTDNLGVQHPAHTATYVAGIYGTTVAKSVVVFIDANGHLGTKASSKRFKAEIKPMDKASEAILALKPVTFYYKKELDPEGIPQFGLVAEEVEKVSPDLVARDDQGKVYTVRYEAVNAMLLNEFLKEHRRVEQQEATITQLKRDVRATITELSARLKEQDSKIEKVSAQVEVSKSAPQMVLNNQ